MVDRSFVVFLTLLFSIKTHSEPLKWPSWNATFQSHAVRLSKGFDGEVGIYIKDLLKNEVYTMNANTPWYLASTVKLPVLIEVLRQGILGKYSLSTKLTISKNDFRDGAGKLNFLKPGSKISVNELIETMIIKSDNTATDMLISLVGLENVNNTLQELVPFQFTPITTLLQVRQLAFSELHPKAMQLTNLDYMKIKKAKNSYQKVNLFSKLIGVPKTKFKAKTLDQAFERYYSKPYNSATLTGYGQLIEKIAHGDLLNETLSETILGLMSRVSTGKRRIVAGLPKSLQFAHKTGTQHRRLCDIGLVTVNGEEKIQKVVIAMCAKKFSSRARAERLLMNLSKSLKDSGIFIPKRKFAKKK